MADLTSVIESAVSEATDAGVFGDSSDSGDSTPDASADSTPDATTDSDTTESTDTTAAPQATTPDATESVAADATADATKETKDAAPKSEADELAAIKTELLDKTPDLAKGRIRVIDHQAVLTRTRRKHEAELAALNTKLESYKPYEAPEVKEQFAAIRLAEHNPDVFFNKVLLNDPRYKALVESHVAEAVKRIGTVSPGSLPEQKPAAPAIEMPKPDVLNPDGTLSYSHEAAQKMVQYEAAQLQAKFEKDLAKLREELAPVTQRAEMETRLTQAMDRQSQVLSNARQNWKGFSTLEPQIRAELAKPGNERIDLFQAYSNVINAHYEEKAKVTEAERAKIAREAREAVVKELNSTPRPKAKPVTPGALPAATGNSEASVPLEDVIRGAMRSSGLK